MKYKVTISFHDFGKDMEATTSERISNIVTFDCKKFDELIPRVLTKFQEKKLQKGSHIHEMRVDGTLIYANPLSNYTIYKQDYLNDIGYIDEISTGENTTKLKDELSNLISLFGSTRTKELIEKQLKELNV